MQSEAVVMIDKEFEEWFKKSGYADDLAAPCLIAWQVSLATCWMAVNAGITDGCSRTRNDIVRRTLPSSGE